MIDDGAGGLAPNGDDDSARIYNAMTTLDKLGPFMAGGSLTFLSSLDDIDVGDFDNDGNFDLVVANRDGFIPLAPEAPNYFFWNDGSGNFTIEEVPDALQAESLQAHDVVVGDIDGDGDDDVLFVNERTAQSSGEPTLLINHAPGETGLDRIFRNHSDLLQIHPNKTVAGQVHGAFVDLDNDDDLDIHLSHTGDNSIFARNVIFWNLGTKTVGGVTVPDLSEPQELDFGAYSAGYGDVDNDGFVDMVTAEQEAGAQVRFSCDDGGGVDYLALQLPLPAVLPPFTEHNVLDAVLGDIDSDGDLDVVLVQGDNGERRPNFVFLHDGP